MCMSVSSSYTVNSMVLIFLAITKKTQMFYYIFRFQNARKQRWTRMFKLVLVDDEYYAIEGMKQMLDWSEYDISIVGTAADGTEGLELIREVSPDIVIADIRMQELDGLEMIRILREEGFKGKIIIISGYQRFEYAQTAIDYKVDKYFTKPLDLEEFKLVIQNLVAELREDKDEPRPFMPELLKAVVDEIDLRYTEDIQLSSLAEKYYCSTSYLSKLFKRYLNMNYVDYVKKRRIEKAKEILKQTNMSIDEIVDAVGWKSTKRFRETFKRYEGISPNEYRRRAIKQI